MKPKMEGLFTMLNKRLRGGTSAAMRAGALVLLVWNLQLSAATITWTGSGPNNNWTSGTDWSGCSGGCTNTNITSSLSGAAVVIPMQFSGTKSSPVDNLNGLTINTLTLNSGGTGSSSLAGLSINTGTTLRITGNGSVFAGGGSFSGVGVNGTLTLGGTLTNGTALSALAHGAININSNVINTGGTILNLAGTVTIGSSSAVTGGTIQGLITNHGAISGVTYNVATINGGALTGSSSATGANSFNAGVTNTGTLAAGTGGSITWNGGANSGVLSAGSGTLTINASTNNTGGTITGGAYTSGVTIVGGTVSGASALLGSTAFIGVNNATTLTASGAGSTLTFTSGSNAGMLSAGAGTLNVGGAVDSTGGTFNNASFSNMDLTNGSITGANNTLTGDNTIEGTVRVANSGALTIVSGTTTVDSDATLNGGGALNVNGGTLNIVGTVNTSNVTLTSGSISLSGALDVSVASLLGGTIDGTGDFTADTVNNGDGTNGSGTAGTELFVGGSFAAGNTTQVADYSFGNYNQDAGGTLGIAFNSDGSGNDELITAGTASLNGGLNLYDSSGDELDVAVLDTSMIYTLIEDMGSAVVGAFNPAGINAIGLVGEANSAPGAAPGWWLVYNGGATPAGGGDVELQYVSAPASTPEPATDVLIGGAMVGLVTLRKRFAKR